MPFCTMWRGVPVELLVISMGAIVIYLFRMFFGAYVTPRLAKAVSIGEESRVLPKFKENIFNVLFYVTSLVVGLIGLYRSGWLQILLIPQEENCLTVDSIPFVTGEWSGVFTQLYYGMAIGYYLQAAVTSVTIDTVRKDRWVMFSHHFITIILLGGSAYTGRFRIGLLVLLTHDISDVFLYAAKVLHYAKSSWDRPFFFLFGISFISLRLGLLPVYIYACMQSYQCEWNQIYLDLANGWTTDAPYIFGSSLETITLFGLTFTKFGVLIAFLITLVCLHFWWATIIIRMTINGSTQDDRSDEEDEEDKKTR